MFIRSVGFIKYELYVIFFFNNVCIVERCCFDVEFDFKWISYLSKEYFELFTWRLIILNLKHLKKNSFLKRPWERYFNPPVLAWRMSDSQGYLLNLCGLKVPGPRCLLRNWFRVNEAKKPGLPILHRQF